MSMNLCFIVKGSDDIVVDFPWQTPTKITYAVLNAKTDEEKIEILIDSVSYWAKDERDLVEEMIERVKKMLSNEYLELTLR